MIEHSKRILVICGTRPEAIKLAPVVLELRERGLGVILCNTEQQKELSNQTLAYFGLEADVSLDVMTQDQTLAGLQTRLSETLEHLMANTRPDAIIVQGDTMSAFMGGVVGFYHRIPVFHVEAGLRSYDLGEPFPEEALRQMLSRVTTLHFAPTQSAVEALLREGIEKGKIVLTGNTVIDALYCLPEERLEEACRKLAERGVRFHNPLVLVTVHRRENHGERLERILDAMEKLAYQYENYSFVIPVHPNPHVHDRVYNRLGSIQQAILTNPLDYPELVAIMRKARLIMTDSGGIQEEAPTFRVPVLVMRYETERMEGVQAGFSKLVGADTETIVSAAHTILSGAEEAYVPQGRNPYGDGHAAERIAKAVNTYFAKKRR